MRNGTLDPTVFLTLVQSPGETACARLLIDSLRSFGGALSHCPIWVFETEGRRAHADHLAGDDVEVFPLHAPDTLKQVFFASKVLACAQAEEMAASDVRSLIWIDPACLVIQPPVLFDLGQEYDAAVRPVHIRNVGLPAKAPLDRFWRKILDNAGVQDLEGSVETFVGGERIRPYFNSHAFAVRPSKGLLRLWLERFEALASEAGFREELRQDQLHHIFLHQAVWSVLLVTHLDPARIRWLPPEYNYPYNLHDSVPEDRRAKALNDPVSITYEERSLNPDEMDDIEIHDPLRSWLLDHAGNHSAEA